MTKLSKREITLLIVLAILIINVCGIIYYIVPAHRFWQQAENDNTALQLEYQQKKTMVDQVTALKSNCEQLQAEYDAGKDHFFTFTSAQQLDAYLDDCLKDIYNKYSLSITLTGTEEYNLSNGNVIATQTDLQASGSYDTLIAIVSRLQQSSDYVVLSSWDLQQSSDSWYLSGRIIMYCYQETMVGNN